MASLGTAAAGWDPISCSVVLLLVLNTNSKPRGQKYWLPQVAIFASTYNLVLYIIQKTFHCAMASLGTAAARWDPISCSVVLLLVLSTLTAPPPPWRHHRRRRAKHCALAAESNLVPH